MEQDKFFKYFKYALGEIILVVLGILIALKINQYNETQKTLQLEQQHLRSLSEDLRTSNDELERVIHKTDRILSNADSLWNVLEYGPENFPLKSLMNWTMGLNGYTLYSNDQSTARELIATGEVNIIRNGMIREIISTWDARLHKIRKYEDECLWWSRSYQEYTRENLDLYRMAFRDSLTFPSVSREPKAFFQNKDFLYILAGIERHYRVLDSLYRDEKQLLDTAAIQIQNLITDSAPTP